MVFIFPHELISIHAPTRGATVCPKELVIDASCISIHAPTRGATPLIRISTTIRIFQSTLPRGERHIDTFYYSVKFRFQSTLPRGERQSHLRLKFHRYNFNPRSHEGSDSNFRQEVLFSLSKNCLKYLILTTNYFN